MSTKVIKKARCTVGNICYTIGMKKTYIKGFVLVLVMCGVLLFAGSSRAEDSATLKVVKSAKTHKVVKKQSKKVQVKKAAKKDISKETSKQTRTEAKTAVAVKEFTVSGQNFSFEPSSITVKKGDKVKITFKNTQGFHDFRIDELGVATNKRNLRLQKF